MNDLLEQFLLEARDLIEEASSGLLEIQGSLTLYTTSHCRPAPDRLTSHCATVHSQHFQLH